MAGIRLQQLSKQYPNGYQAVHAFDLDIRDGEFLVLVGPSGCGKSTTLRMIAGLEEVTGGEILIDDKQVTQAEPAERDIAMVFQNYALYPHMSVRENMAFGLRMRKMADAEIQSRVDEASRILSVEPLLERRPRELSGGQRQRVALGRAIVRQPKVFLFDEPLSNLDAKLRVQMRTEIARLHHQLKTTMIYVTHDQVEAMTLGDRIVVMNQGAIQQVDTPLNLYRHPVNRFVAGFIGSPAMNFFRGDVQDKVLRLEGELPMALPVDAPDGPVTFGIRPEDMGTDSSFAQLGEVDLEVVEQMGHETLAYFRVQDVMHVARLDPDQVEGPGQKIRLGVRLEGCHLFSRLEDQSRLN